MPHSPTQLFWLEAKAISIMRQPALLGWRFAVT